MGLSVRFWGTRGSVPTPPDHAQVLDRLRAVLAEAGPADIADAASIDAFIAGGCRGALPTIYGGNTSCVEVTDRDASSTCLILDMGSGARALSQSMVARRGPISAAPFHILMSHLHWDHIQGFPFFVPAYIPGNELHIYACHPDAEAVFRSQNSTPYFPVPFDALGADIQFHHLDPARTHHINGFDVTPHLLHHSGDAYGYRLERHGRTVVYATDAEHKPQDVRPEYPYVSFIRDADLLVFDAQYSLAESISVKEDWGHSSNIVGVELARLGGVRHLVLFHHEPMNSDAALDRILHDTRRFEELMREDGEPFQVSSGYDGLKVDL